MPHKGPEPGDGPVKGLLSPRLAEEILGLQLPPAPEGYDPNGSWELTYRIWGSSSFYKFQNKDMGFLRISREPVGELIRISVDQVIVNADGIENIIKAEMDCLNNELTSPAAWKLETHFTDYSQCIRPELSMHLEGGVENDQAFEICGGKKREIDIENPFATDWGLIDAVQRFNNGIGEFSLLDGLTKVKTGHRLSMMDTSLAGKLAAPGMQPKCICQTGHGILPHQYWLDESARPVIILFDAVMFIADDDAEEKKDNLVTELIKGGYHHEY